MQYDTRSYCPQPLVMKKSALLSALGFCLATSVIAQTAGDNQWRPAVHYTPSQAWMNDPNGMVYVDGVYHLFYQYTPGSSTFGPVHWGHATTRDLIHWQEQPVALSPDSLGYIFSGSAVLDEKNTSGFDTTGKPPIVAFYTSHDAKREQASHKNYEAQSLAYSLDGGTTWLKYAGNPVLKSPGSKDFRDPKVSWYEAGKKWIMALAVTDHIEFYSSANLKAWKKESEFGKGLGAHGGVWECPDLFPLEYDGKQIWVLLVSINPGGPSGGSATQYFTGSFNGRTFAPDNAGTKWIDGAADNYAGVTWSNTGARRIFLGWMSNWDYAAKVPTQKWRGAMTIPRELAVTQTGGQYYLTSMPVRELNKSLLTQSVDTTIITNVQAAGASLQYPPPNNAYRLDVTMNLLQDCSLSFSNASGETLVLGYDKAAGQFYVDRSRAGRSDFHQGFAVRHTAPRLSKDPQSKFTILIDRASVEFFADGGLTSMTDIFFPQSLLNEIRIKDADGAALNTVTLKVVAPTY